MSKSETIENFKSLATKYGFTLIPARGKSPFESGWQRWCIEKRQFNERDYIDYDGTLLNAAVTCGPSNGILALDIDDELKFKKFSEKHALDIPDTFTVKTGRGGRHLYYAYPNDGCDYGNRSKTKDCDAGYDVRGIGGVVIAPGSIHPETKNAYSIVNDIAIAEAPKWLKDKARNDSSQIEFVDLTTDDDVDCQVTNETSIVLNIDSLGISKNIKNTINSIIPAGKRSEEIWRVIKECINKGVSKNDIFTIFNNFPIGAKYREKGSTKERWLEKQIEKAKSEVINDLKSNNEKEISKILRLLDPVVVEIFRNGSIYYARLDYHNALVTLELNSPAFQDHINRIYYDEYKSVLSNYSMAKVRQILRAEALSKGVSKEVNVRIAHCDGKIYLDLGDESWKVIEIDEVGWRVVTKSPVPFIRTGNMVPLPMPDEKATGDDLNSLKSVINCSDDHYWTMIVGWIINCFLSDGPYFVLSVHGAPGSAKSTLVRLLHSLIDPSRAHLKAFHRNTRELMISARQSRIQSFDNLSGLTNEESDALCRLSTGGSYSVKENYSDGDEYVINACRPIIISGVNSSVIRGDLADRVLNVELERLPQDIGYISDDKIKDEFDNLHPKLLGSICSIISVALKNYPNLKITNLPRMAKPSKWITAAESGLGWKHRHFIKEHSKNQKMIAGESCEQNSLIRAIISLLESIDSGKFIGTSSYLFNCLNQNQNEQPADWPKTANSMSRMIKNLIPVLEKIGIKVEYTRQSNQRLIILTKID
jgi:hypothetical protein